MKPTIERRDQLEQQRKESYDLYAAETRERQRAEVAVSSLESQVKSDPQVEPKLEAARVEYTAHLKRANRALDASKAAESELDQLLRSDFGAFAEAANEVTKRCDGALEDLVSAYVRAQTVWQEANAAWAPLCRAHRIPGVGSFPLASHLVQPLLDYEVSAKPPGVEIFDDGGMALEEETLRD